MKLEPNMYVRTFEGKIFKIQDLKDDFIYVLNTECYFCKSLYGGDYCFSFPNENDYYTITKASHSIIDLVECGDFVNSRKVYKVGYNFQDDYVLKMSESNYENFIYPNEIKSIVTKEMFSSMEYRLGDDE